MSGAEQVLRAIWWARVQGARPNAEDRDIQRAVDSIMRDPNGRYAKEIKETAERRERDLWIVMDREQRADD